MSFIIPPGRFVKEIAIPDERPWREAASRHADTELVEWMTEVTAADHMLYPLVAAVFSYSPFLSRLLLSYPELLREAHRHGFDAVHTGLLSELERYPVSGGKDAVAGLMHTLRVAKAKLALLIALADMAGAWELENVTAALSGFAKQAVSLALDTLLLGAHENKEISLPSPANPSHGCGIIVLGMGKLGANELNYSSDIDLILLFTPGTLSYRGRQSEQKFMNKLAQDLVHIMQERTRDGYVFRTDLRLRPDPASTPPAINTEAAYAYYESVGQNWERAAMIKASPIAGDSDAGRLFLKNLTPFMWRRSLDFASINDIHSIKRQMDTRQSKDIKVAGHNIKLGMGGIREIEFYTQIHQLIWGGREPKLRSRPTCETLAQLASLGLIEDTTAGTLTAAYSFLRTLEHRLQMVADEQTHSLPTATEDISAIARFMGFANTEQFSDALLGHLRAVHDIYASSFKSAEKLGDVGNLVFTGVSHDPDTLQTLRGMGYVNPETVSEIVMGWHHGSRRSTRTQRARELLTELMPLLLKRLAETANPDAAFIKFDEFLHNLPAGVQLFSLFQVNPHLLGLIADILGSAPNLAERLSKSPHLLDAVIDPEYHDLPSPELLEGQLHNALSLARNFEDRMNALRQFRGEKQFQAGVQLLKGLADARQTGTFLASLADLIIRETYRTVTEEFTQAYGTIEGSRFGIIALGKLGGRDMTFSSDIDLVFVYDAPDMERYSSGEKSFTASVYYNRFAQRLLNAFTARGHDGRLYEVDTRLRPSGAQGLLAVSANALEAYFDESAWTFEYMAFTKARVVYAEGDLAAWLDSFIQRQLAKPHPADRLKKDVADMRERIEKEFNTHNIWNLKYARGGLIDLDFIAQYLLLRHAPTAQGVRPGNAHEIFDWLRAKNLLPAPIADELLDAERFIAQVFNMLRLCADDNFDEAQALPGLKKLLCDSTHMADFDALKNRMIAVEQAVYGHYISLVAT